MSVLEVERKFTVGPEFVWPDLTADGWVVAPTEIVELDATYYDTEDLRLARGRITLRRRVGGKDAGWHLKLPAGSEREEIQRPLGRGAKVPKDLADLVLARTRGQELQPVARIRTTRTLVTISRPDGVPLVELADDSVVGERLGGTLEVTRWREIEAEMLTAGNEKALATVGRRLRRAGAAISPSASKLAHTLGQQEGDVARAATAAPDTAAPDTAAPDTAAPDTAAPAIVAPPGSAGAAVAAYLNERVQALLEVDPGVRRESDDAVHAMRVESRRLRSALSTFRPLLDRAALGDLDSELRWLAGVLGEVRDREVLYSRFKRELDELPDELVLGPVRARLLDTELRAGQLRAHTAVLEALRSPRYLTLLDSLDRLAAAPPFTAEAAAPARTVLPRLARRAWKRLAGRAVHALATDVDADLHDCRKAAKRARYTLEAVAPVLGRRAARLGNQAKQLQTVLGEHQDSVVARTLLRHLATTETQAFTYGILYAAELQRARSTLAEFADLWHRAERRARGALTS